MKIPSDDRIQLKGRLGPDVPQEIEEQLAGPVTQAIANPDADVDAVLTRAKSIAEGVVNGRIRNLLHYANKALSAVAKRSRLKAKAEPIVFQTPEDMAAHQGTAGGKSEIEARLLIEEVLGDLSDMERKVLIRNTQGFKHREIAQQLGISEVNSRFHLSRAKRKLAAKLGEG